MPFAHIDERNRITTDVAKELHHPYMLGFTPATLDGRLHKLEVRVPQSNYTVRARKNYIAEESRPCPDPSKASTTISND